jgi:Zn-dependent protease
MLYALARPVSFGVLLLSVVVGLTLHGWVQARVADRQGDRRPRLEGRLQADPRRHLDPFGCVGALISGLGWARPVEVLESRRTGSRGRLLAVTLSGPAVNLVLGAALLLLWRALYAAEDGGIDEAATLLQHGIDSSAPARALLLLAGASQLYLGALSLVPLPPLDGGRLLFGLAPRTQGWLKAEHQLVERNIGVAVLLALLLIPLGGPVPILPQLLDVVVGPLLGLLSGA